MGGADREVTELLRALQCGEPAAGRQLFERVYGDLRDMARRRLAGAGPIGVLQPTALVHECFLRLVGRKAAACADRGHFFAIAARAMRDVIIDEVRRDRAQRRGGDRRRVLLSDVGDVEEASEARTLDMVALAEAIERLAADDATCAEVVTLHLFGGLTHEEVARSIGLPVIRVRREWAYARAYLQKELEKRA